MKSYVHGYKVDIQYGQLPAPASRYANRTLAESACRDLNRFGVWVGSHRCSFAVDRLPEGDFGIICVCHPQSVAGSAVMVSG